jgi:signal transduction histidine kinase
VVAVLHSATLAVVVGLALVPAGGPEERREPPPPLLTEIRSIRALSQDEGGRGYPVRLRGIVTHFDQTLANGLIVYDGEFGQWVEPPPAGRIGIWPDLRIGDVVEIDGRTVRGGFAPNVQPAAVRKIGHGALPAAKRIAYAALLTGRHDCEWVEVLGVVQRAWLSSAPNQNTLFADVALEDGVVRAMFWDYAAADLERFIDARVRLRGNVGAIFASTEQLRGVSLFAGRARDIEIVEPAPDPFALPIRPIRHVYTYSSNGEVNRRVRVRGVVAAAVPGEAVEVKEFSTASVFRYVRHVLYVKDETGGARIETNQAPDVRPGDIVEAAGFPAVTPGKPILRNAVFRVRGSASEPTVTPVAAESALNADYDAELVRMDAQLLGVVTTPTQRVLVLKTHTGDTAFEASLDPANAAGQLQDIRPGSRLRVTGVYSYQGGPLPSFRLFLRSPSDVVLVAAAPWWTLRHSIVMAVMLAAAGAIGWYCLKTVAMRKRREYQAVLAERTRVARELHDTLEQGLTGISLQLEAVAGTLATSPETARQSLAVARQMLRYSLEETRRSVMDLRSTALENRDLAGALASLARQMTLGMAATADVRTEGEPRPLDAAQEHHLLRIGLEAVTNALKHGGATRIDLTVRFDDDQVSLVVQDDGCGLPREVIELSGAHFGLQGIRERVDKLGGVLEITGSPGGGTRIAVAVPLKARPSPPSPAAGTTPVEAVHG